MAAAGQLGVEAARCLVVGDTPICGTGRGEQPAVGELKLCINIEGRRGDAAG